jgi:AhpD family alkylhydroperoxidase
MFRGDLPRADRELVTLRTAWRCGCWYVWVQHAALARRAGLDPQDVAQVADGPSAGWGRLRRLLLEATDELLDRRVIADPTWEALRRELTDRQLIELCFVVGHYEMLAMTLNSLGVEPEASALAQLGGADSEAADRLRDGLLASRQR